MSLPNDFKRFILEIIKERTKAALRGKINFESYDNQYEVNNPRDFEFGMFLGIIRGAAITHFLTQFNRELTQNERDELKQIIQNNTSDIKEFFYKSDLR